MKFLAYNAYTQVFALFDDEAAAQSFRDHQAACGQMTEVVPVQTYASAADAIVRCKPLETTAASAAMLKRRAVPHGGFKHGELPVIAASVGTGKSRMTGLDYADVIDTLQGDGE